MTKTITDLCRMLFLALALSLSGTATSSEATRNPAAPAKFSIYDTDSDGYLSSKEYEVFFRDFKERHEQAGRPAHRMLRILSFEQIDSDKDGRVSADEMVSALRERRQGPGWRWKESTH